MKMLSQPRCRAVVSVLIIRLSREMLMSLSGRFCSLLLSFIPLSPLVHLFLFTGKGRICLPDYFYSGDISEDYSVWIVAAP